MPAAHTLLLTTLTLLAFAGNSVLCRLALRETGIDAASFTTIRLASGAVVLWLIVRGFRRAQAGGGNWISALMLFAYAAGFSFAYLSLTTATGALLLFGAVQATMILWGLWRGERFGARQLAGLALAVGGLVGLLLPGLSAPPLGGAALMLMAGAAWGVYSIRGKGAGDATRVTVGNFLRTDRLRSLMRMTVGERLTRSCSAVQAECALASGAITSGHGYAIWYILLRALKATSAATVQLSVPVIAALGGIVFLGEAVTLRFVLASAAVLGGIALVILNPPSRRD
ncbi:MAG: EamA family transporter [Rhodocyclaceae bacterium UTPRO2]|nr:MAG: EamA family transporter [Rhodocyclaceae bacterium UTPRO2]